MRLLKKGGEVEFKGGLSWKISETTGIEIQSQHWVGKRKILIEGISVEYFPNTYNLGRKEKT